MVLSQFVVKHVSTNFWRLHRVQKYRYSHLLRYLASFEALFTPQLLYILLKWPKIFREGTRFWVPSAVWKFLSVDNVCGDGTLPKGIFSNINSLTKRWLTRGGYQISEKSNEKQPHKTCSKFVCCENVVFYYWGVLSSQQFYFLLESLVSATNLNSTRCFWSTSPNSTMEIQEQSVESV